MFEHINIIAVLVSALLSIAVRSIWYSPLLFGNQWMKSLGVSIDAEHMSEAEMIRSVIKGVLNHSVLFTVIAEIIALNSPVLVPLWYVTLLLVVLMSVSLLNAVIWEKKSLAYFCIHTGYVAIILFGGVGVIAFWPW
jgi:hypothetical protein